VSGHRSPLLPVTGGSSPASDSDDPVPDPAPKDDVAASGRRGRVAQISPRCHRSKEWFKKCFRARPWGENLNCEPRESGTPGRADPSERGDPPRREGPATCVPLLRGSVPAALKDCGPPCASGSVEPSPSTAIHCCCKRAKFPRDKTGLDRFPSPLPWAAQCRAGTLESTDAIREFLESGQPVLDLCGSQLTPGVERIMAAS
jgi:hypothetical protein